jgi:hypothetical protein
MEKHEIYLAVDAENNAAIGWGVEETIEAIEEYGAPPHRVVLLSATIDTPQDGDDEDHISVVDVQVPPQPADPGDGDGEEVPPEGETEAPAEVPVPPELPAEVPAQQPEPATAAA